jgi:hypothetical protein
MWRERGPLTGLSHVSSFVTDRRRSVKGFDSSSTLAPRVRCRGILHGSESIRCFSEALYALASVVCVAGIIT